MLSPSNVVGMAFQNPVLLEWRSILKNVMLPLEIVPNSLSPASYRREGSCPFEIGRTCGF